MTNEQLKKANELKAEIQQLEDFMRDAEKVWEGKIIKRESKFIFKNVAYGTIKSSEFHMKPKIKDKVLDVLRDHLNDLKTQLANL